MTVSKKKFFILKLMKNDTVLLLNVYGHYRKKKLETTVETGK